MLITLHVYSLPVNAKEVASSPALSSCEKSLSKSDGDVEGINVIFDNLRGHVKHISWSLERHAASLNGNCLLSRTFCTHLCSKHYFTNDVGDDNHTCVLQERTKLQ